MLAVARRQQDPLTFRRVEFSRGYNPELAMVTPSNLPNDPIAEGAHARARRIPKDACPYPRNSEERMAWMEGYDGRPRGHALNLPMARA